MGETVTAAAPERAWTWRFADEDALRAGLEEYTAHLEAVKIGRYGKELIGGDESDGEQHMCKVRIRAEVDACLEQLQYPFFYRLLDTYYRRGWSCEHQGWCLAARTMGLRGDPKSRWDRDTFERCVDLGISRLWRVHEDRYRRRS